MITLSFTQLLFEYQVTKEERNSALFLGRDYSAYSLKMQSIREEIEKRRRGQENIAKFRKRCPNH